MHRVRVPLKSSAKTASLAIALVFLGSAAGASPDKLDIDNKGGGRFSGHASANWTEEHLRQQIAAQVCGGNLPRQFDLRVLNGHWLFGGTC